MMEENIRQLFEELNLISVEYLTGADRKNIQAVKEKMPQIQQFATWFLEENRYGIEPDLYRGMSQNLLLVLEDMVEAIKQEDHVLLHDATAYGVIEYLKLFVEQGEEADGDL